MSYVDRLTTEGIQLLKTLNPRRIAQYLRSLSVFEWVGPALAASFFGRSSDVMRIIEIDEQSLDLQMKADYRRDQLGERGVQGDSEFTDLAAQLDRLAVEKQFLRNSIRYRLEVDLRDKRLVARGFVAPFTPNSSRIVIPHDHWSVLRLDLNSVDVQGAGVKYLSVEIGRVGSWRPWRRALFRLRMKRNRR